MEKWDGGVPGVVTDCAVTKVASCWLHKIQRCVSLPSAGKFVGLLRESFH